MKKLPRWALLSSPSAIGVSKNRQVSRAEDRKTEIKIYQRDLIVQLNETIDTFHDKTEATRVTNDSSALCKLSTVKVRHLLLTFSNDGVYFTFQMRCKGNSFILIFDIAFILVALE